MKPIALVFLLLCFGAAQGMNPLSMGTDGDGMPDNWEIEHLLNPCDARDASHDYNSNGLTNLQEYEKGYEPFDRDTDKDGLVNFDEINSTYGFLTDPLAADTDRDGLSDKEEINIHKTDPTNPDSDEDGLNDGDEIKKSTNPNRVDSDRDGLKDGEEVLKYKTDATKRDTDCDGLPDNKELWCHGTDPTNADTDRDGEEILGFGAAPIAPSRHALTYEEFISSNAYAGEYLTVKATVERIKHNPIPGNYSIFLHSDSGKRGIVKVESSWHYDSEQHVDDRFGLSPRKGDTIVVVGIAKRICGSNREIEINKKGKMYLVLSPEEARGRWLPSKRYVKVVYDGVTVVTPTPSPTTPAPTPSPTPIAQAVGDRGIMEVEERKTSLTKLFLYILIGIVVIDVPILLYIRKKL